MIHDRHNGQNSRKYSQQRPEPRGVDGKAQYSIQQQQSSVVQTAVVVTESLYLCVIQFQMSILVVPVSIISFRKYYFEVKQSDLVLFYFVHIYIYTSLSCDDTI